MRIVICEIDPRQRDTFEDLRRILDTTQANVHAFVAPRSQYLVS